MDKMEKEKTLDKPSVNSVSLKEHIESQLYALDKRIDTAVQNIKDSTASAFLASQKAIDKQESFQTTYNIGHNDLSRKMEAQYKEMIPRTEHIVLYAALSDKVDILRKDLELKADILRIDNDKITISLREEIAGLRESRSQSEGKGLGNRELLAYIVAGLSIIGMIGSLFN